MRILITSGRGPAECRIAVRVIATKLSRDIVDAGFDCIEIADKDHPQGHGPGSLVLLVDDSADNLVKPWIGPIQYIWKSTIRPDHRRKNWFVSISKLSEPEAPETLDESKVEFTTMRAGGPGGQHQNTTDSAVRASYDGITIVVRDGRSQHQNKKIALRRIADMIDTKKRLGDAQLREEAQKAHDSLERGNPVKTIKG